MNTRLAQIKNQLEASSRGATPGRKPAPRNPENEKLISELYDRNRELVRKNQQLTARNKKLAEEVTKRKKELARRRPAATRASAAASTAAAGSTSGMSTTQLGKMVTSLRTHLQNAESLCDKLRAENARLKGAGGTEARDARAEAVVAAAMAGSRVSGSGSEEILALQREVRESHARHQLLQTRFDHLEAKARAQRELQGGSFDQLEELNRQVRDLRRALQQAGEDKEAAEEKAEQAAELMERVRELQTSNRDLEEEIQRLCQSPFISEAYEKQERVRRLEAAEERERQQKLQLVHLRETAQTYHSALQQLQRKANDLMADKESAQRELDALKLRMRDSEAGLSILHGGGSLALDALDVDTRELEAALTMVKRRSENPGDMPFLEKADGLDEDTVPGLRRKLQQLQLRNLELQREVERTEQMLTAQTKINRELHLEVEELSRSTARNKQDLGAQVQDLESLRGRDRQRIAMLEAQVKQHLYALRTGGKAVPAKLQPAAAADCVDAQSAEETAIAADLAADIGPDENIVEVWVRKVEWREGVLEEGASTFGVVDFFDYESVATPIMAGLTAPFDFATTYKVALDDVFLRFLATENLLVELNVTKRGADFDVLANSKIPLASMLEAYRPVLVLPHEPLYSVKSGQVQGHVHLEIRLAVPVVELYRSFLANHPEERAAIEQAVKARAADLRADAQEGVAPEAALLGNEISVSVLRVHSLPHITGRAAPRPYVHFKLLGFQDAFTKVIEEGKGAGGDPQAFEVVADERFLRLLRSETLEFTVLDDNAADAAGAPPPRVAQRFLRMPAAAQSALRRIVSDAQMARSVFEEEQGDTPGAALRRGLQRLGLRLDDGDVDEIVALLSEDGDASYGAMVRAVRAADEAAQGGKEDEDEDAFLGEASLPLAALAEGDAILQELALSDGGFLQVRVEWARPLSGGAESMPHALSGVEVEALLERFSPVKDGQVDYIALRNSVDPPPTIARCLRRLHDVLEDARTEHGKDGADVFALLGGREGEALRCEDFVSGMQRPSLGVKLQADELEAVFRHIDAADSGVITRDAFLEFARPLPHFLASVTRKLRSRVSERRQLGLDPFQPFYRMDHGRTGKLTRREVKFALRELGLRLLDEPEPAAQAAAEPPAPDRGVPELDEEEMVALGAAADDGDAQRRKREQFNQRVQEQYERMRALEGKGEPVDAYALGSAAADASLADEAPIDAAAAAAEPDEVRAVAVSAATAKEEGDGSASAAFAAAAEEEEKEEEEGCGPAFAPASPRPLVLSGEGLHITDSEAELRQSLNKLIGVRPVPHLATSFAAQDAAKTGRCTRQQFAFVLASHADALRLGAGAQRGLVRFFDASDGAETSGSVDYRAFLRFLEFDAPRAGRGVDAMRAMTLPPRALEVLRSREKAGGLLSYDAFCDALRELGHGHLSAGVMAAVARLFQLGGNSDVHYIAFLAALSEMPAAQRLEEADLALREAVMASAGCSASEASEARLREAFAPFQRPGEALAGPETFAAGALRAAAGALSAAEAQALYFRLDPFDEGLSFASFARYIRFGAAGGRGAPAPMKLQDVRRKAQVALRLASEEGCPGLIGLEECFAHYDWRESGKVDLRCFAKGCALGGLTLTAADCGMLVEELGDGQAIPYQAFLSLVAPPAQAAAAGPNLLERELSEVLEALRSSLRTAHEAGMNVLELFEAYDEGDSGVLTTKQLVDAMANIGYPVVQREARAVAEAYGDGAGGIAWRDFLDSAVALQAAKALPALLADMRRELRRLDPTGDALRAALERKDPSDSGRVERGAFQRALQTVGVGLKPREALQVGDAYPGGAGQVAYREFLDALRGAGGAADTRLGLSLGASAPRGAARGGGALERLGDAVRAAVRKGVDYRLSFEGRDDKLCGLLPPNEVRAALYSMFSDLTEAEEDALIDRFSRGDGAGVAYLDMLYALPPDLFPARHPRSAWHGDQWRFEEKFRQLVRLSFDYWVPGELRKAFHHFDVDREGDFNEAAFSDGLRLLKRMGRSSAELEHQLFRRMDLDGDGRVTYPEFLVFIRDPNHADVASKLARDLRRSEVSPALLQELLEEEEDDVGRARRGSVGDRAFERALSRAGVGLQKKELARMIARFSPDEDGRVDVRRVVAFSRGAAEAASEERSMRSTRRARQDDSPEPTVPETDGVSDLFENLRRIVQKAQEDGVSSVAATFNRFDKDLSGHIGVDELRSGLESLHLSCGRADARQLLGKLGGTAGRVNYIAFARALGVEETASGDYDRAVQMVLAHMAAQGGSLEELVAQASYVFESKDRSSAGRLGLRDTKAALRELDVELSPEVVVPMIAELDKQGSGKISFDRLLDDLRAQVALLRTALGEIRDTADMEAFRAALLDAAPGDADVVSGAKLRACLRTAGASIGPRQLRDLCAIFAVEPGAPQSAVDFGLLLQAIGGAATSEVPSPQGSAFASIEKYLRIIKDAVGTMELRRRLEKADSRRTGRIKMSKFSAALSKLDCLSGSRIEKIVRKLSRTMDYVDISDLLEYAAKMKGSPNDEADEAFDKLKRLVRHAQRERNVDMLAVFKAFDTDDDGTINTAELRRGLKDFDIDMSAEETYHLMRKFKSRKPDKIKYKDFVRAIDEGAAAPRRQRSRSPSRTQARSPSRTQARSRSQSRRRALLPEDVQTEVRRVCRRDPARVKELFGEMDRDGSGSLSREEFRRGLQRLEMRLGDEELYRVVDAFDADGDGRIDYGEFMEMAGLERPRARARSPSRTRSQSQSRRRALLPEDVQTEVRRVCRRNPSRVKELFGEMDRDGSGSLSREEFRRGLQRLEMRLGDEELYRVVDAFDADGDGRIDYGEFMEMAGLERPRARARPGRAAASRTRRMSLSEHVEKEIRRACGRDPRRVKELFAEMDRDGSGTVSRSEFRRGLQRLNLRIEEEEIYDVVKAFDADGDGRISYREFMDVANV